ncbi:MAG: DNA polymerase III subunit gamma/tau, partial [Pseudomonadota bacterium]|nr:DNA polymerase III subunit gamma/tau [Pseudomonadota bacterium]
MTASDSGAYRVLARKYRPTTFADLKGQEALVRTLSNAFAQGRVAHAFILTGVRGVGKTTTARIVAKGLNCLSADGPTVDPCGTCANCLAITEDSHVDVIEMDAASRTGVDDIREIIEGVRYKPVSARFKVYIIDEVHMLSRNAFNALLKTLEEPPPHVKFVFATTEIRKVPITVQSRCQRFDLRRLSAPDLIDLLGAVAATEQVTVEDEALALIARAADGSARDGLSILDQAMAMAHEAVGADQVRTMLGLADRAQIYDLFEAVMAGRLAESLELLAAMHAHGADPLVVLQDLLALTHWVTKAKTAPSALTEPGISELERTRGAAFAEALSVAVLGRTWQMLLKGVGEVQIAPQPMAACEMVLIRLAHVADLPSPGDLVKQLTENAPPAAPATAPPSSSGGSSAESLGAPSAAAAEKPSAPAAPDPVSVEPTPGDLTPSEPTTAAAVPTAAGQPRDFDDIIALCSAHREARLLAYLSDYVRPVALAEGQLTIEVLPGAPSDLAANLAAALRQWTGTVWAVDLA